MSITGTDTPLLKMGDKYQIQTFNDLVQSSDAWDRTYQLSRYNDGLLTELSVRAKNELREYLRGTMRLRDASDPSDSDVEKEITAMKRSYEARDPNDPFLNENMAFVLIGFSKNVERLRKEREAATRRVTGAAKTEVKKLRTEIAIPAPTQDLVSAPPKTSTESAQSFPIKDPGVPQAIATPEKTGPVITPAPISPTTTSAPTIQISEPEPALAPITTISPEKMKRKFLNALPIDIRPFKETIALALGEDAFRISVEGPAQSILTDTYERKKQNVVAAGIDPKTVGSETQRILIIPIKRSGETTVRNLIIQASGWDGKQFKKIEKVEISGS